MIAALPQKADNRRGSSANYASGTERTTLAGGCKAVLVLLGLFEATQTVKAVAAVK